MFYSLIFLAIVFFAVSLYILISLKKVTSPKMKIFGYVSVVILWLISLALLVGPFYGKYWLKSKLMPQKSIQKVMPY